METQASSGAHAPLPTAEGGVYLDLRGADLPAVEGIDESRLEKLARALRGLAFSAVDGARSGHPGGSSSKAEMVAALLASGVFAFDPLRPKHPGRDQGSLADWVNRDVHFEL